VKVLDAALAAMRAGAPAALVTVTRIGGSTPRSSGARMLVRADGSIVGTVGGGTFEHRVIGEALEAIRTGTPRTYAVHLTRDLGMCCGGAMEAFVEPLRVQEHLVVYGAGHVGTATARIAHALGFEVWVCDERDELATADRFPEGTRLVADDPRRHLDELPWGPHAYHLVVTHSHALDQDLLEQILPRPFAYVGMIGSRAKVAKFFLRFKAAGIDEELFRKVSAPVGLDIGAETPEEIAVAICAELVRVRRRAERPAGAMSEIPLEARGGDGRARPPALDAAPVDVRTFRCEEDK
jgi:xanthine dehydrogenase accessory factor